MPHFPQGNIIPSMTSSRLYTCVHTLHCKVSYIDSRSGSMNGVAPNGSMLARSILLMIELPAMDAARPARRPAGKGTQTDVKPADVQLETQGPSITRGSCILWSLITAIIVYYRHLLKSN